MYPEVQMSEVSLYIQFDSPLRAASLARTRAVSTGLATITVGAGAASARKKTRAERRTRTVWRRLILVSGW